MPTRKELKRKAQDFMSDNYGKAICILLTIFVVNCFFEGIGNRLDNSSMYMPSFLIYIIQLIVSSFLLAGTTSFFLKVSRRKQVKYEELFNKTDMIWKFFGGTILTSIFVFLWSLLLIVPGIIAGLSYSMTFNILIDNPDMSIMDAINESKEMMNGHKWEYFVLQLSFIGWAILSIFTLGLLNLWLIPYISTTNANYYNALLKVNKK